jgi:hypothetical protein
MQKVAIKVSRVFLTVVPFFLSKRKFSAFLKLKSNHEIGSHDDHPVYYFSTNTH